MQNFEKLLRELSVLVRDPYNFIFNVTAEAMHLVDLKKERLIEKLDKSSAEMIQSLTDFRLFCKNNSESDLFKDVLEFYKDSFLALESLFQNFEENPNTAKNLNLHSSRCRNLISSLKTFLLVNRNYKLNWIDTQIDIKQEIK